MSDDTTGEQDVGGIELAYELDEPPQKVWRAISTPEFRESWLPTAGLADPEATAVAPGREIRYRLRDAVAPFLESTVTFRIAANDAGGTTLRIIQRLDDARLVRSAKQAANRNGPPPRMLAA